jgi:nucleoside-diphosphate-sugar epimerase
MAVLITGCEGSLGARLAQKLHSKGAQVVGLTLLPLPNGPGPSSPATSPIGN